MTRFVIFLMHITFLLPSLTAQDSHIVPDEMFVQFAEELPVDAGGSFALPPLLAQLLEATPVLAIRAVFPATVPDRRLPGMERTYRIKVHNAGLLSETCDLLARSPAVVYAEPVPLRRMFELPNDPLWNSQYHLSLLQVDSARSIHPGDSSVIIAIIDGGVNYLHEDLYDDIYVNAAEDVDGDGFLSPADNDGFDADSNGFIDDVIGWDFVNLPGQGFPGEDDSLADNDPMDFGGHGTHVAGDAAAVTDNGVGIASTGGDSHIMCLRAGMTANDGFGYIYYSVEGIYYAAANGAKVISMSYGGPSFSATGQQAVDFAHSQGAVCIAAAGNDNNNVVQYPANYNHVLAVAATDAQDLKAGFSNYGPWIDLCAPGESILSTVVGGGYGNQGGTSMSTPIVAGVAGLTWAMFPQSTNQQIIDRLLSTCDDIDSLNPAYAGQLGAGRVNAFRALDRVIRVLSYQVQDNAGNGNGRLDYGETADLLITLKNTYQSIDGVSAVLRATGALLTVQDSSALFGSMPLGGTATNSSDPFTITVGNDTSISIAEVQITISAAGGYQYRRVLKLPVGQRDILVVNDDQTSGPSRISYYSDALDNLSASYDVWDVQSQGLPGGTESGYGTIIWYTGEARQNVLTVGEQLFLENYLNSGGKLFLTGQNIAYDLVGQQNGTAFFQNYLHAAYIEDNANDFSLDGLPGDPIGGGQMFIILGSGGANNQNSPDVITAAAPAQPAIAYDSGTPERQAAIYYSGAYQLVYFAFGWEGINNQGPAQRREVMARVLSWLDEPTAIADGERPAVAQRTTLDQNYPNPFNPSTNVQFEIHSAQFVTLSVFDILGRQVTTLVSERLNAGKHRYNWDAGHLAGGLYFYRLEAGSFNETKTMLLLK